MLLLLAATHVGQGSTGELRLIVRDPGGMPLRTAVTVASDVNQVAETLETGADGTLVAKRLPFGRYRVEVTHPGFATYASLVDIQSVLPRELRVTLSLARVETQVTVSPDDTLLDTRQSRTISRVGTAELQSRVTALPGRSVSNIVNTQPGWLLEANGILHPRGAEYQVQFVVDGLPITDNRSASFAPELDAEDMRSMSAITAGFPAEYGRKLGGVVEIVTARDARQGMHGSLVASGGSFDTRSGHAQFQYGWAGTQVGVSGNVTHTNWYLDPPVEENFTNTGTGSNVAARFERDLSASDRLSVILRRGRSRFLVPNELVQQEAGQRQERTSTESTAQLSYQHVFSDRVLGDVRGMFRNLRAGLSSNPSSTPILAEQDRGFREGYLKAMLSAHAGAHEWKAGFEANLGTIDESLTYQITDPIEFDPDTPGTFSFADRRRNREQALFVQDQFQAGAWTINTGLRWDHYSLILNRDAVSPRVAVAWSWPEADVVFRASYDRAFQTPAIENLLLASSPALESLDDAVMRLPVSPSVGNFFDLGFSKRLFGASRLDVSLFSRQYRNFADDDVLFNTGVSFPMAFDRARIRGAEVKLEFPSSHRLSGYLSYGYMVGTGALPITGGLLVGDDAASGLTSTDRFPISQDQRHTVRGRMSYDVSSRIWIALAASYGSGLPVEFVGDRQDAIGQYGERIVNRVNLEAGRVRPSASLDASVSAILVNDSKHRVRLQADLINLTNRLNVINFAGRFSGTAIAPPRSVAFRVHVDF
jgi:hypothetical protein